MMFNWVDWVIVLFLVYEMFNGWKSGFVKLGVSFIAFALSLWIAILANAQVSIFFNEKFGIAQTWSSILSYISIALVGQTIFTYILTIFISKLPAKIEKSIINNILGSLVSGANNLTTISFVIVIIMSLPLKGTIQNDIRSSSIGSRILGFIQQYGGPIKDTAKEIKDAAAKFVTVSPGSTSSMPLDIDIKESELVVDDEKERELFALVNKERTSVGLKPLIVDVKIVKVARLYSKDMLLKKYFSHIAPDGTDLEYRLKKGEVIYALAGENIAYAPDVATAHQGLMNSPDHKKNIMDSSYNHVGIGIISTKKYGLMVTQNFTN